MPSKNRGTRRLRRGRTTAPGQRQPAGQDTHPGAPEGAAERSAGSPAGPTPTANQGAPEAARGAESTSAELVRFEVEGLVYELDRHPRPHGRRSVVTVRLAEHLSDPGFTDRVDIFSFKSRQTFARAVADAFGRELGSIMGALAVIVDQVERGKRADPRSTAEVLTPERRQAAEEFPAGPKILDRLGSVAEAMGHVGEERVRSICYLVATSRVLEQPLSVLLLAPSGSGKSAMLDSVVELMPPEDVVSLARLTPQALFYAGEGALRHKLVVVDEYEGQAEADHAVRVLQTKGELTMTAALKGKAEQFRVAGPVAVMSGTTLTSLDPQNTSRCLELALDDSPAQTRRVQEAQARRWAGMETQPVDLQVWRDAQRLLAEEAPVRVVIPYAPRLRFQARTTTDRRSSAKLLGLIAAHAALHLRQRKRDRRGRVVAVVDDYAAVHALLRPEVEQQVAGLSPRAARVLRSLGESDRPFTRRELAEGLGLGYNTIKRAVAELVDQELVAVVEVGPPARYRVLDGSVLGAGVELLDPAELERSRRSRRG